ncbi:hypothetical protein [Nonomuraea lactucae]|uniref:hypothetical protein n=1 Tax=Nonomuraea lactucae TaxID=2249762 RepID=UPI000DE3E153|nr:hypothetical protein [Nonomuraea lactucae]
MLVSVGAAVLLYMGWAYLDGYLRLFNLRPTDMGFGVHEYALYGVNLLSPNVAPWLAAVPLVLAAVAHRARLAAFVPVRLRAVGRRLAGGKAVRLVVDLRFAGVVLTTLALVFALIGVSAGGVSTYHVIVPLVFGPLLLTWPLRGRPYSRVAFATSTGIAILCLLWTGGLYAQERGGRNAEQVAATLAGRTQVAIYSADTLALNAPGVTPDRFRTGAFKHRYTGLRLLLARGERYYLVPLITLEEWKAGDGRTFVLKENDDLRVELMPGTRREQPG